MSNCYTRWIKIPCDVSLNCAFLLLSIAATSNGTFAKTSSSPAPDSRGVLNLNVGRVGIFDANGSDLRYGLEYRFKPSLPWQLMPTIGGATAENDALYVYVGLRRDFAISQHWVLSPSLDIGFFNASEALELGSEIEFREGLEIAYKRCPRSRIGFAIYHLSNGGIGDRNPGTEAAILSWSIQI